MKILLIQQLNPVEGMEITPSHIDQIKKIIPSSVVCLSTSLDIHQHMDAESILLSGSFSEVYFSKMKDLRWIHVTSAGINSMPLELKNSNILLTNSSGVHPIPISEQIFSYMLLFARDMHTAIRAQNNKKWIKNELNVFELHGKTIGIVGLGRIGQKAAELAKAFGMHVLAITRNPQQEEHVDEMYTIDNLPKLLGSADFVVNCLPGTDETKHLFSSKEFSYMKKTAYFINIGRGTIVNENDLVSALKNSAIAGAGLDVFETEPLPENSPLWKMRNVIITPHHAGKTPRYMDRVIEIFCQNLESYKKGEKMPNLVDKMLGY